MNTQTVHDYYASQPLTLPIQHSRSKLAVTELRVKCQKCKANCVDVRGTSDEWPNCIRVQAGGVCHKCSMVTYFEVRFNGDGGMLHRSNAGWIHYPPTQSLWRRFVRLFWR